MIGMKVEDHLDGATNFISWKSRVLILKENDLLKLVNEKVPEPDAEEDKSHWRKSDAKKNLGRLSQGSFGSSNIAKEDI